MASVSLPLSNLPPRTIYEWLQVNHILSLPASSDILKICNDMETQLGYKNIEGSKGEVGSIIEKILNLTFKELDPEDRSIITTKIQNGSEQEFATTYRDLENRINKLQNQEKTVNFYLRNGVPSVKLDPNYKTMSEKITYLSGRIGEIRTIKNHLSIMFDTIQFVPYNRIFQSATNVFIIAPFKKASELFKTKKIETLALASFATLAGYSVVTNTNASFLIKSTAPLFFMYIGHLFSKTYYNLTKEPSKPQTFQITMSPS